MERKRLLVIEDHADSLELLVMMLDEKYQVSAFASGSEALRKVEEVQPSLVILDVRMYPVSGPDCLAAIRALPGYRNIPAIAFTAFARDIEKAQFLKHGFQAVVTKPVLYLDELEGIIDSLLGSEEGPVSGQTFIA